jgi:hypothetical protein
MVVTNTNVSIDSLLPQAGSDSKGRKIAFIDGESKLLQNDTLTLTGATTIDYAVLSIDSTGASETHTISGKVITLTSATGSATVSGIVVYR